MFLEGWIPDEKEDELVSYMNKSGVYYEASKPSIKDKVPVMLKNNKFNKLFEMIGELYSMPNMVRLILLHILHRSTGCSLVSVLVMPDMD